MKSQRVKNSSSRNTRGLLLDIRAADQARGFCPGNSRQLTGRKNPTVAKVPRQQSGLCSWNHGIGEVGKPPESREFNHQLNPIVFTTKPRVPHPQGFGQFQGWDSTTSLSSVPQVFHFPGGAAQRCNLPSTPRILTGRAGFSRMV